MPKDRFKAGQPNLPFSHFFMNQKSSICAIICEYDPFHNGHKYQIEQARLLSGCDFVLCLMSGSLVQRGYPAILDKHTRAKLALQNGADMVVLLPTVFATSSAQDFATGAIKMLDTLGVQCLCFGVEPSCLSSLEDCKNWDFAKLKTLSKDFSKQGANSAKAYQLAVSSLYGTQHATAFENPNFVLAYEYQKALHFANSKILTLPIARTNAYHHLDLATPFASATAIRHAQRTQQDISQFVPYEPVFCKIRLTPNCLRVFWHCISKTQICKRSLKYTASPKDCTIASKKYRTRTQPMHKFCNTPNQNAHSTHDCVGFCSTTIWA